jgi:hypothetical protein
VVPVHDRQLVQRPYSPDQKTVTLGQLRSSLEETNRLIRAPAPDQTAQNLEGLTLDLGETSAASSLHCVTSEGVSVFQPRLFERDMRGDAVEASAERVVRVVLLLRVRQGSLCLLDVLPGCRPVTAGDGSPGQQ